MEMHGRIALLAALVAGCGLGAVQAAATPGDDFNAVYGDWKPDHVITPCWWTRHQLQNAYDVAASNPDMGYSPDFQDAVQREIKRWKDGDCAGVSPASQRRVSPLHGARIVAIAGRGGAGAESVKIKNTTRKTLAFRKATLRNHAKGRAVFPATFKLKPGRKALVHVGCAPGKGRPSLKGTTVWLCRRSQLFRDRGDTGRLADSKGIVVSQLGFGTFKGRVAY